MLGALEKYLMMAAEKVKAMQGMSKMDLLAGAARGAGKGLGAGIKAVGDNPLAAGIGAGAGLAAGSSMGSDTTPEEEEILKAYGL